MKNKRVYDCSNSSERPPHRSESFGPKENDIMRGLKKYCNVFGYEFIDQPQDADVIVTNDIYPKDILALDKPRVKRMDGVFWENRLKERNELLNQAALDSDWIVFISNYSKYSFTTMYEHFAARLCHTVILNDVDETVYFRKSIPFGSFCWVASASNWARKEKRFEDLKVFANDIMDKGDEIVLIGNCESKDQLKGGWNYGHIDDEIEMNDALNSGSAFINLSYRDAAPKVVCQAINCKMPILYADSGGVPEIMQRGFGVPIKDPSELVFEDETPRLNVDEMRKSYRIFKDEYWYMWHEAQEHRNSNSYMDTMNGYFGVLRHAIKDKELGRSKPNGQKQDCNDY